MAISDFERDWLALTHAVDQIDGIIGGSKLKTANQDDKKSAVIGIVQMLEFEIADDKWTKGGKDTAPLSAGVTRGRTYWSA